MRKIINGRIYDTKTATEVAGHSEGYGGDFRHYVETLYRTQRGRWFLAGEGGPMSSYATPLGNGSVGGGSDIIPLSDAEVKEWMERTGNYDALEVHFAGELEEA